MEKSTEKLQHLVNSSGFPLQLRIQHEIEKTKNMHGWEVCSIEHPWQNMEAGTQGYVDLVLLDRYGTQFLVLECKRVRDAKWVFLIPSNESKQRKHAKAWVSDIQNEKRRLGWFDLTLSPSSPEAGFCVIRGQDKDSKPMMERIASDLIDATESIALEAIRYEKPEEPTFLKICSPVIVTTAEIVVCRFDPSDISMENGEICNSQFETVPLVRFRKSLTTRLPSDLNPNNLADANRAKERTVFIVNASKFVNVLVEWEIESGPWIRR